eukprot:2266310-Lingulodinium_polyedra.AAC.1
MRSVAAAARSSPRIPSAGRVLRRQRFHHAVMADWRKAQPYRATAGQGGMRSSLGSPASPGRAVPAPGAPAFAAEGCVPTRHCPGPAQSCKGERG